MYCHLVNIYTPNIINISLNSVGPTEAILSSKIGSKTLTNKDISHNKLLNHIKGLMLDITPKI